MMYQPKGLSEEKIGELELIAFGEAFINEAREKAQELRSQGELQEAERWEYRAQRAEDAKRRQESEQLRKRSIELYEVDLFGGLSGLRMREQQFEIADGLILRSVYAHVMSAYLIAFNRPEKNAPHTPPFHSAGGGLAFDVTIQVELNKSSRPFHFERQRTIWWVLALIRLLHPVGVRMPVISNTDFRLAIDTELDPVFWPYELNPRHHVFDTTQAPTELSKESLDWIRENALGGAELMKDERFATAFSALDSAHSNPSTAGATLLIWAALEALYRPGRPDTTKKLCSAIAAHLYDGARERGRLFDIAKQLYEARGNVTHAAKLPKFGEMAASMLLAKLCFTKTIEDKKFPDSPELIRHWKTQTPVSR